MQPRSINKILCLKRKQTLKSRKCSLRYRAQSILQASKDTDDAIIKRQNTIQSLYFSEIRLPISILPLHQSHTVPSAENKPLKHQRKLSQPNQKLSKDYLHLQQTTKPEKNRLKTVSTSKSVLPVIIMTRKKSFNNALQDYKRKNQRADLLGSLKVDGNISVFLRKAAQLQTQFIQYYEEYNNDQMAEILVNLINYAIDLDLPHCFAKSVRILAEFYLLSKQKQLALFFFNQSVEAAMLLEQKLIVIESLIGMGKVCAKINLHSESIVFLKKALEYSWFFDKKQIEVLIYDEIGRAHYRLGDIQRAKKYHQRFIYSLCESQDSAYRLLSKERLTKSHLVNLPKTYQNINTMFLLQLKVPIKSLYLLPPLSLLPNEHKSIRENPTFCRLYHKISHNIDKLVPKILSHWIFEQEIEQPNLPSGDWTKTIRIPKFKFIDFQCAQSIKKYQKKAAIMKTNTRNTNVEFKKTLDQKVQERIKNPGMDPQWYEKLLAQVKRDHRNKLHNVRGVVRMRGSNNQPAPSLQLLQQLYHQFFQSFSHQTHPQN